MSTDGRAAICLVVIITVFIVPCPHNTSQVWFGGRGKINVLPYVIKGRLLFSPLRVMLKVTSVSMLLSNLC